MPFIGSFPAPMRAILHEHTRGWDCEQVNVLCSGNFTLERCLAGRFRLHSNDVSLYTTAIGELLSGGEPPPVYLRDEYESDWGWLLPYIEEPLDRVATIMLGTQAFTGATRTPASPGYAYWKRMTDAYRRQWPRLHAETVERLKRITLRLDSYQPMDAAEYIHQVPADAGVCSFPPFYTGGYESLYKGLNTLFTWPEPPYEVMGRDEAHALLAHIRDREHWLYGTDSRLEGDDHESWLRGVVQPRGNVTMYVYSSGGHSRVVMPRTETEPLKAPALATGDVIGDKLTITEITTKQYNAMRAHYLSSNILGGTPAFAAAILSEGRIVGIFAMRPEDIMVDRADAFLLADFPVAPTDYPRLSKLVVMAATSHEARMLIERRLKRRVRTVATTAFSNKPVSMKYRGVMNLHARRDEPGQGKKFRLIYTAPMDRWTLDGALKEWNRRYVD